MQNQCETLFRYSADHNAPTGLLSLLSGVTEDDAIIRHVCSRRLDSVLSQSEQRFVKRGLIYRRVWLHRSLIG